MLCTYTDVHKLPKQANRSQPESIKRKRERKGTEMKERRKV